MNEETEAAAAYVNGIDGLYRQIDRDLALGPDLVHVDADGYGSDEELADAVLDRLGTIEAYHGDLEDILEARDSKAAGQDEAFDLLDAANAGTRDAGDHLNLAEEYLDIMTASIEAAREKRDAAYEQAPLWEKPALTVLDGIITRVEDRTMDSLEGYRELVEDVNEEYQEWN